VLTNSSDEVLERVVEYMDSLGITSLDDLGTIELTDANSGSFEVSSGVFLLRPNSSLSQGVAFPDTAIDVSGWLATSTPWTGEFESSAAGSTSRAVSSTRAIADTSTTARTAATMMMTMAEGEASSSSTTAMTSATAMAADSWLSATGAVPQVCFLSPSSSMAASAAANASTSAAATGTGSSVSLPATVVQYTGSQTSDVAVILADEVILDAATVTLSDSITEFIIVANTIESRNDSEFRWVKSYTQAASYDAMEQADDGTSPGNSSRGADGGDGDNGEDGAEGYSGSSAPSVSIYVKEFLEDTTNEVSGYLSFPTLDVRGQHGGVGQDGQDGGDGGDGAKGQDALSTWWQCRRGAGYGGNGGSGGEGGDAGDGGDGGDGGTITINFVEFPDNFHNVTAASAPSLEPFLAGDLLVDGGWAGAQGEIGEGGSKGEGGEPGDPDGPWCQEEPGRAGQDGGNGSDGALGSNGSAGNDGSVTLTQISLSDWENAFTAPYLVSASPTEAYVGDTIIFETANISDGQEAMLIVQDDLDSSFYDEVDLTDLGDNQFEWEVPEDWTASRYTVHIERASDDQSSTDITNTYSIELIPVVTGFHFTDDFDARPGGTAYVLGHGLRDDSRIYYDGEYVETEGVGQEDTEDPNGVQFDSSGGQYDWLQFQIPVTATDDDHFVRNGETDHTVYLDQVEELVDSEEVELTLKKHAGLTFLPSEHGFGFSNGEMADAGQDFVGDYDDPDTPTVNETDTVDKSFSEIWNAFMDSYQEDGDDEVEDMGGFLSPQVWANFLIWYAWWSNPTSATCLGLSSWALEDYFSGVTGQPEADVWDAQYEVMKAQSHLLSDELLGGLIFQTVLDGVSTSAATESTVEEIVSYFEEGGDSGDAPVIVMIPELSTYGDVIYDAVNLLAGTLVAGIYAVNPFDATTAEEAWDAIEDVASDFWESLLNMVEGIGESHALAPYMAVYDEPDDALPSRLYFYDSNGPGIDDLYMEISEDADGNLSFDYSMADDGSGDYIYGTSDGWVLASATVDYVLADADLLFDDDDMLDRILNALTN